LAKCLGIHRHTLRRELKKHGIDYKFTSLTDKQLDEITRVFKQTKPNSGFRYLMGFLGEHGLKIQRR
ncbi:hypothetical protein C8R41DRAFT_702097, partial [Lentinula lateritia]